MNSQIQILSISVALLILAFVTHLIRSRKLREEFALLWLFGGFLLLAVALTRGLLDRVAGLVGVAYPPSLLLLGAIGGGVLLALHFSVALSRLSEHNKRLTQELALMRERLERLDSGGDQQGLA